MCPCECVCVVELISFFLIFSASQGPIEEWMVAPTQQETNDDGSLNLDTIQGRGTNPYAGTSMA